MDQTIIGTIRPDYVEAVEATRMNRWLVPGLRRWHWAVIAGLTTWFSSYGWCETSWRTVEALAVTDAETAEAASDTDAVFEPIFSAHRSPYSTPRFGAALHTRFVLSPGDSGSQESPSNCQCRTSAWRATAEPPQVQLIGQSSNPSPASSACSRSAVPHA